MRIIELFLSPRGRVGRRVYWAYLVFGSVVIMTYLVSMHTSISLHMDTSTKFGPGSAPSHSSFQVHALPMTWLLVVIVLVPAVAIVTKRWHDIGKSAWWLLLSFAPVVLLVVEFCIASTLGLAGASGLVFLAAKPLSDIAWLAGVFCNGVLAGNPGENRYGPPPRAAIAP